MTPDTKEAPLVSPGTLEQACQLIAELRSLAREYMPEVGEYDDPYADSIFAEAQTFLATHRKS